MINRFLAQKALSTNTLDYEKLDYIDEEKEYVPLKKTELLNNSQTEGAEEKHDKTI